MNGDSSALATIVNLGLGGVTGSLVTAIVQAFTKKGESRATAASLITEAAAKASTVDSVTIERLSKENIKLRQHESKLLASMLLVSTMLDEIIDELKTTPEVHVKLKSAAIALKDVLYQGNWSENE